MQKAEKKKTWDSSRFRRAHMTFWPRTHPVMFPHVHTDHWSKMKTMVPAYLPSVPAAMLKETGARSFTSGSMLPPLTQEEPASVHLPSSGSSPTPWKPLSTGIHLNKTLPQNLPQYRNVFNERARMGFRYWMEEKRAATCKAYSFGAYKTFLGLPKV